jgi:hypothetical protein
MTFHVRLKFGEPVFVGPVKIVVEPDGDGVQVAVDAPREVPISLKEPGPLWVGPAVPPEMDPD